jgi:hypothetical protein
LQDYDDKDILAKLTFFSTPFHWGIFSPEKMYHLEHFWAYCRPHRLFAYVGEFLHREEDFPQKFAKPRDKKTPFPDEETIGRQERNKKRKQLTNRSLLLIFFTLFSSLLQYHHLFGHYFLPND